MSDERLSNLARTVIDSNSYMALGTADEAGHRRAAAVIRGRDPERGSGVDRRERVTPA